MRFAQNNFLFLIIVIFFQNSLCTQGVVQRDGTFTVPLGINVDSNTPLKPFRKNKKGEFWTANTVRNYKALGYTYPEIVRISSFFFFKFFFLKKKLAYNFQE